MVSSVRVVTRAEADVVQYLLSLPRSDFVPRSVRREMPRRTFQTVRNRVISNGWVSGRCIPDPTSIGHPIMSSLLAVPYAEKAQALLLDWRHSKGCAVLWSFPALLFGIFFSESREAAEILERRLLGPDKTRTSDTVLVDCGTASVPVYFDFEGGWCAATNLGAPIAYPQSLGGVERAQESARLIDAAAHDREILRGMLERTNLAIYPPDWGWPEAGASRRDARLERAYLDRQVVSFRNFLNLDVMHTHASGLPTNVIFVSGTLLERGHQSHLFRDLVSGDVHPFLFLTDSVRVLFAALAFPTSMTLPFSAKRGSPVMATLESHLRDIGYWREPVEGLLVATNHRYHQLIPEPENGGGSEAHGPESPGNRPLDQG